MGVERNQSYANNYYDESHYWMCFPVAWNFLPDNKMSSSFLSVDFKEVPVSQTYCCTGFVRQCVYIILILIITRLSDLFGENSTLDYQEILFLH